MQSTSKEKVVYVADFETVTTGKDDQEETEVWAAALTEVTNEDPENVLLYDNLDTFMATIIDMKYINPTIYFHNLKFDGEFIAIWLLSHGFVQSYDEEADRYIKDRRKMANRSFTILISDTGAWYQLLIYVNYHYITIRDSMKLIPLTVKAMGDAFETKHRKTSIEYTGYHRAHGYISRDEREYIKNDVLVVAESLQYMFSRGHDKMTIGSCCMADFKRTLKISPRSTPALMPDLREIILDKNVYGSENAERYVRRAYRGGWCYVNKYKQNFVVGPGVTYDVNSLYPSVMHSESGSVYPCGKPTFWVGDIPEEAKGKYYFVRVRTRFKLKPGYLPFVQIKGSFLYPSREHLETSDVLGNDGDYHEKYLDIDGRVKKARPTLTLTCTDWDLMQEHYNLFDTEILDGCYFNTVYGLFDAYIDKWAEVKMKSTGGMRQIAKLFLNNLYGKLAASEISNFKKPELQEDGSLGFHTKMATDKMPGYIPMGAAVTSYARNFTIRAAQAVYHEEEPGFVYADTDSLHLDTREAVDLPIDDVRFCHWKKEREWERGLFVRAKTYIETTGEGRDMDVNIKCAGMPQNCKDLVSRAIRGDFPSYATATDAERNFLFDEAGNFRSMRITDFKVGLTVPGKLIPRHVRGGIVLQESVFTMLKTGGIFFD